MRSQKFLYESITFPVFDGLRQMFKDDVEIFKVINNIVCFTALLHYFHLSNIL